MINFKGWHFPDKDTHFQNSVEEFPKTTYQQKTIDEAYTYVKDFDLAIDVGANIGLHSVRFSQKFNSVYAFEPVHTNFECLQLNIKSLKNTKIHNIGISNTSGILDIKVPADTKNCGAYSFVDFDDYNGDLITESVTLLTLDSFNLKPNLIKIDTQGYEEQVILGSINTIKESQPVIIVECESKEQKNIVFDILIKLNYSMVSNVRKDFIWVYSHKY
jgi:FkbM family methyltransferase